MEGKQKKITQKLWRPSTKKPGKLKCKMFTL